MRGQKVALGGRRATHGEQAQGLGRGLDGVRIHRVSLVQQQGLLKLQRVRRQ